MRRAFCALFFSLPIVAGAQEPLPPDLHGVDKLNALVQHVSQIQAGIKTLTASFEQTKTSHLLAQPSVSRGTFYYQAPDKLRWEYKEPRPMIVLLAGGVATTYRPAEKRAERVEVGHMQRRIFRFLGASEPLEKLKGYFNFTFHDRGPGENYLLSLQPTAHAIKKRMKTVDIVIDRHTLLPSATDVGGAVDYYQWSALLRSVSGFESYRKIYSDVITPRRVAELLILRHDMPRSLFSCMSFIHETIEVLCDHNTREVERASGELHARLRYGKTDDIIKFGLHEYLMEFLDRISALGVEINRSFLVPTY